MSFPSQRITMLVLALTCLPSLAQDNKPVFDPHSLTKTITPFLDDETQAVAHIDLTRTDFAPLESKITALVDAMALPEEQAAYVKREMLSGLRFPRQWREQALRLGAREVFLVYTVADFPHSPIYAVVPVPQGVDSKAIQILLTGAQSPQNPYVTEVRDGVVIWATTDLHERLKARKQPTDRPELTSALQAAGDTAAQIVTIPTADARRVLTELMPDLPLEGLGTIKGDTLGRGLAWAALGINLTPDISLKLTIQSPNAASAASLHEATTKLITTLKSHLAMALGEVPQANKPAVDLDALARAATPTLAGHRITLTIDANSAARFTALLAPSVLKSYTAAQRVKSMSNIRMILQGCLLYANENRGQYPPDFPTVLRTQDITPQVFTNPTIPWKEVGYIYVRPVEGVKAPADQVIVYEAHDLEKMKRTGGLNVGFGDGHVEFMHKETFQKMLAESIKRNEEAAQKQPQR